MYLITIISAIWEVEIMRVAIQGQPRGEKLARSYLVLQLCMVGCTCHCSYVGSISKIVVQASLGKNARPYLKSN
jgi:hypothetical protein